MKKSCFASIGLLAIVAGAAHASVTGSITGTSPDPLFFLLNYNQVSFGSVDTVVRIADVAGGEVDLAFVTDTTGSMGGFIGTVNSVFSTVLTNVSTALPGVSFKYSVSDYRDLGDGGPYAANRGWNMAQPFTFSAAAAAAAISGQSASGGGDYPEANFNNLHDLARGWVSSYNGRNTAQKIVVWGGDAVSHDGSQVAGDYNTLNQTLGALSARGAQVYGISSTGPYVNTGPGFDYGGIDEASIETGGTDTRPQASTITGATGGSMFYNVDFTDTAAITAALINAITTGTVTVGSISLTVDGALGDWDVQVLNSPRIGPFGPGDSPVLTTFNLQVTAPNYDDDRIVLLTLRADGAALDTVPMRLKSIPTPASLALLGLGGLVAARRRRA